MLVEQRDGQAVKLGVRGLRDDLVDDLVLRVAADPIGDELAQELAFLGLRGRKHLHTSHVDHAPPLVLIGHLLRSSHVNTLLLSAHSEGSGSSSQATKIQYWSTMG